MKELEPNSEPSLLDSESPWPGLRPFSEENAGYFFGRDREVREIARKVQQETVTLLFGKSGLGKTSILRAGLSPLLRKSGFVPIYIRLNHFEESLQLEDQVEVFMEEALDAYRIDAPRPIREETLWEHFHKKDGDWWDEENRLLKPVLIFDQFEEILTSGQENSARVVRSAAFLTELEDLIENRPPASLLERFKTEKGLAKQYDLDRIDYRVVLSLREDYLADLEGLRERLRMIMHNRYRLLPLNGVQAMNVILEPGGHLVDETAANDIVNFVASPVTVMLSEEDMGQSESRQVEPALLSVILRELNNHRIRAGEEKISSDMVINRRPEKILSEFYEESLKGLDSSARLFIEKQLLTASGARNRVAEEDAITLHGLTEELIEKLINRRIIQREKTARMSWLELSHDTLTQVVRLSAEDYQRRQRRRRFIIRAAAGFLIVIGLGVFGYYWQAHEQNLQTKEAAKLALDVAEDLEYNYTISMRGKQRILDRLDDGFVRLRGFAGDSSELKARNIRFLLASAAMQLETGYFQRASDSLKAAQALLWVDDSGSASLPASNLLLARFELVRAETENVEGDSKDAWKALRQAEHLLQSTISAGAEDSMERTELWQRMNRIKVKLLSEQGDWNGVVELFKAARAEINATLAETEINLKMTEQEAEAKRIHQQVLFTELLKLHSERTYLARTHNLTDFSDIHAEFEEDLQRAEPLFNGDARRQWLFFRSMRFVATAFYYIFDSKHIQGRAAIDIAIDNLAGLVRSNPDNLRYRHVLGEILLRRASFTRNRDPLQSKVDIQAARSLAFTLRKDSPHPYQGFNLSIRADFYQAELDYANKVDGADSALKMLARLDAYRNEIAGTLQADSLAVFGYYWAIKSLIRKGSLDRALEMADSALNLLEARKNDWDEGFLANRRYWIHDTILTAEKADDIEEAVWSRHFQGALEMAETLIQRDYEDPSWIEKKTWLLSLRGKRYARVKNYPKAIRTFEPLAIFGLEQTRRYPDTRNISTNTLYGIRELIKVLHASDNWDGIAKASELLLQHVDPASEREIRYPKDELRYWKSVHKALESARKTSGELYTGVSNKEVSTDVNPQPTKTILDRLDGVLEASNDRMAYLEELIVSQPAGTPNISEDDNHKLDPKSLNISGLVEKDSEGGLYTAGRPLGWRIPSIYPGPTSYNLMGESFEKISELLVKAFPLDPGKKILRIRSTHLPFYDDGQLLTVESGIRRRSDTTKHYLRSGIQVYVLNGTSSPIHKANKKFPLRLQSKADATAYLRFFTTFVHHDDGSFLPVESSKEIPWADGVPQETKLRVANLVRPINVWTEPDQPDTWYAIATINYSDELFHAKFKFDKSGKMKMLEDMSVAKGLPVNYLKFVDKGRTSDIDRLYLHLINGIDISSTKKEIETLGGLAKELDESQADHRGSITTEMLALAHATVPNDITVDNLRSAMENYFTVLDIMGDVSLQMAPAANTQFHSLIKKGREAIEKAYGEGENSNLRKLAGACTSLSYFQLKIRDFDGALSTARRGIEFNSDSLPIYTNYAHALLFLGREEEAMAVYREHKSKPIGKETWDFYVLDDFDQFEKLGITHPGIARVRKMMKQG